MSIQNPVDVAPHIIDFWAGYWTMIRPSLAGILTCPRAGCLVRKDNKDISGAQYIALRPSKRHTRKRGRSSVTPNLFDTQNTSFVRSTFN
jgi:hypothetical protein